MRASILMLCLAIGAASPVHAQPASPLAMPVGTVAASLKPVTQSKSFVGRIQAINKVEIRARVTGFLDDILFKEGDLVAAGAPLYRLEQPPFEADVQEAGGNMLRAQGEYTNAQSQRARSDELLKTSAVSVAQRDQRVAEEQTAQGNVAIAQAKLKTAQINLSYTNITAPIAGRIGRTNVTKGNVVGPDSGVLTIIVSIDPTYVLFPVSNREFLALEKKGGTTDISKVQVRLKFSDGSEHAHLGKIDFVDVVVDRATDTVLVRAIVPNPAGNLVDGELVQVAVEGENPVEKLLIPQAAMIADQEGVYVFVVEDGKAVIRRVKPAGTVAENVIIDQGLKPGDLVVVQGLQTLRPGIAVLAHPVAPLTGG